jgi:hypothetical protein
MRLIFGIILGALLTVGGVYVVDSSAAVDAKPMVNWDVVSKNVETLGTKVRQGWARLTG